MTGIYKITNPSGNIYIGQSVHIHNRWNKYKNLSNFRRQRKLYSSFKKYGYENHKFEIIQSCDKEKLNELEVYYIQLYINQGVTLLNLNNGGNYHGSNDLKIPINQFDIYGNFIKHWESISCACRELNLESRCVRRNLKGIRKSVKGFIFTYENNIPSNIKQNDFSPNITTTLCNIPDAIFDSLTI